MKLKQGLYALFETSNQSLIKPYFTNYGVRL